MAGAESSAWNGLAHYAGPPRSVMWRHGAAHLRSAEEPGAPRRRRDEAAGGPQLHAHFAIQVTVALRGQVTLRRDVGGGGVKADGWIVGSDRPHWMQAAGPAVSLFADPTTDEGRRMAGRLRGTDALTMSWQEVEAARGQWEECWQHGWRPDAVERAAARVLRQLTEGCGAAAALDTRVKAVLQSLRATSSENVPAARLAASVGLSESRLAHLFTKEVGIPLRQYRLSLRMQDAVAGIAAGRSLTEAAHEAGFADAAQFCRICRRMFGSAPSGLPGFEVRRP